MRTAPDRDQLVLGLRAARTRVLEAIAGLSEEQMSRREMDGWSVKDHLAHLTVWHEMRFFEVTRIARGGRAAFPVSTEEEAEPVNSAFAQFRRDLPLRQVLEDLEFAREMVIQTVAGCEEEALDETRYEEIGIRGGAEHDISHAQMIAAWRGKEGI